MTNIILLKNITKIIELNGQRKPKNNSTRANKKYFIFVQITQI